jgi:uncharacterized membrane protein YeaQ/YmgE (transglycosylase-associated protein family)
MHGAFVEGWPMLLNILLWCLFGLVAGMVAQFIMPGKDPGQSFSLRGLIITILLGIVGAVVGGYISSQFFGWDVSGFNLPSFGIAVAGALLLLILYRLVMSIRRTA